MYTQADAYKYPDVCAHTHRHTCMHRDACACTHTFFSQDLPYSPSRIGSPLPAAHVSVLFPTTPCTDQEGAAAWLCPCSCAWGQDGLGQECRGMPLVWVAVLGGVASGGKVNVGVAVAPCSVTACLAVQHSRALLAPHLPPAWHCAALLAGLAQLSPCLPPQPHYGRGPT